MERRLSARKKIKPKRFEIDIPEHYPSSPLCPMNPLHPSGGTGICVYHGRRRSVQRDSDTTAMTETTGSPIGLGLDRKSEPSMIG